MLLAMVGAISMVTSVAAQGDVTEKRVLEESASGENWFLKGGNFRGEHFSPLSQVTDENVENLGLAWATDLPIPDGIDTHRRGRGYISFRCLLGCVRD
jgi:quinohemoprotein ethanol dehydrogenase